MIIRWLHISDLHFQIENFDTKTLRSKLITHLDNLNSTFDFILISGDCFYRGEPNNKAESDSLIKFVNNLVVSCKCDKNQLYITPGNHDLKRSEFRSDLIRKYTGVSRGRKKSQSFNRQHIREINKDAYNYLFKSDFYNFFDFYQNVTDREYTNVHQLFNNEHNRILNVNTCILSGTDEDEGCLSVCDSELNELCQEIKNDNKINIAFMHHSFEHLRMSEQCKFQHLMEDSFIDIVFCGHSHRIGLHVYDETKNKIVQLTCGSAIVDNYSEPSFYICEYDTENYTVTCQLFSYSLKIHNWHLDNGQLRAFNNGIYTFQLPRMQRQNTQDNIKPEKTIPPKSNFERFGLTDALPPADFFNLRYELLKNAKGDIVIVGQSLENAFDIRKDSRSIVSILKTNKNIKTIDIFLTDPIMFDYSGQIDFDDSPIKRISGTMSTILSDVACNISENQTINIYFIPLIQLDHMVFANDTLLLRHTLLWTSDGHYKATPLICKKVINEAETIADNSMYYIYEEYIKRLKSDSIKIETYYFDTDSSEITHAKRLHYEWRNKIYNLKQLESCKGNIKMYKLYRKQLISDIHSSWDTRFRSFSHEINWSDKREYPYFKSGTNGIIETANDLFKSSNLLDDFTQRLLLPFVEKTQYLLDQVVKKYDKTGIARIFPSLDIGFPNNIQRLAGGFATGMLIVWKCGTPVVPIDTTVNVCSSSYYEFEPSLLKEIGIRNFFTKDKINKLIKNGSEREGYAFSFSSGNHFLLLCKARKANTFYLILHSSAKQFKDSYLGLYPKKDNWYANSVKTLFDPLSQRYINYLKDTEAERFISLARSLNQHNNEIHNWFAKEFCENINFIKQETYHHYGMPTDFSIAIGTYVLDSNDIVPLFSRKDLPICLFKPDENMWRVELAGKFKYVIPHGWGQAISTSFLINKLHQHEINDFNAINNIVLDVQNSQLVLRDSRNDTIIESFNIDSDARFSREVIDVRNLIDSSKNITIKDFNSIGKNYLGNGEIVDILDPVALFSRDEKDVKYYYDDEASLFD